MLLGGKLLQDPPLNILVAALSYHVILSSITPSFTASRGRKFERPQTVERPFQDEFQASCNRQAPMGLGVALGAGAVAGAVASSFLPGALSQLGQATALEGATGLGFGLVAVAAYSALKALTASRTETPSQPLEPVAPPPPPSPPVEPHPDFAAGKELERTALLLGHRGSLVHGYVDALWTYRETAGRRGRETLSTTRQDLAKAQNDWEALQKERTQTRLLEESQVRHSAQQSLVELLAAQQKLQPVRERADGLVQDTAGRLGRDASDAAKGLATDLTSEIARLRSSLGFVSRQ
jgi:hypothetical protein